MKRYDPLKAPDPEEWLSMDEQQRISLAQDYHRRARIRLPNEKVHAVVHAIVENQIALGDEMPLRRTIERLMAEGLDRHDAIHAIGMVLMEFINGVMSRAEPEHPERGRDPNNPYYAALEKLTAESWRKSG
jgi:HD superfamily phosphodiesterase